MEVFLKRSVPGACPFKKNARTIGHFRQTDEHQQRGPAEVGTEIFGKFVNGDGQTRGSEKEKGLGLKGRTREDETHRHEE